MTERFSPQRWANDLTLLLNAAMGPDRFWVDVPAVAREFSQQRFPDDPITLVQGDVLPGFDGALFRAPDRKKGWGIIYNNAITSPGRINFTLAHEFGHYLVHRLAYPDGIKCGDQDFVRWDTEYGKVEAEANEFAAALLMPLDDFRRQISARAKPDLDTLGGCADRYRVSLIAATLRWLRYTERRAVLVVSREGFILWARSSEPAFKTGAFFRTANRPPVPTPPTSLAAQRSLVGSSKGSIAFDAGVWLPEPCEEMVLFSDQYEFTISLLHLGDAASRYELDEEVDKDTFDIMMSRTPGSSWLG